MNAADLFSREPNPVRLAAGETLFEAGQPGDAMYVVLEGTLDVVIDGRVIEQSTRGQILGEMAIIDATPRSGTVVAREPSVLAKLDAQRFQRIVGQNPFFATYVMKSLVDRIRRVDKERAERTAGN